MPFSITQWLWKLLGRSGWVCVQQFIRVFLVMAETIVFSIVTCAHILTIVCMTSLSGNNLTSIQSSNPTSYILLICLESLVGAVSQLLAIHFSPLMTSHPPCSELRSSLPRSPLSGSIKLLYHMMAVPFLGGRTRLAELQLILRLNSSDSGLSRS